MPRRRAISWGLPAKSSPGGTSGLPRSSLGVRLPEVDLRPGGAEARRQILLQGGLGARRIADVSRRRVEADQVGRQAHELIAAAADLVTDELLLRVQHQPRG